MKTITFLNTNHEWGGGEKWHFEMAKALNLKGHKVQVICSPGSKLETRCKEIALVTLPLKTSNLSLLNPLKLISLIKYLRGNNSEILFTNLPIDTKLASITKNFTSLKKLIYRRGMPHPIKNTILNRYVFSKVDTIIANSQEIANSLCTNLKNLKQKTVIILNGVHPLDRKNKTLKEKDFIIGSLGRLVNQKRQFDLIEVAKILEKENFSFQMKIAGKGPLQVDLQESICALGLGDKVQLVGHVDPATFLDSIDLFIFPSEFEGSANALIESLQSGTPAIAYEISSMPEVINNGVNGELISPFNTQEVAKAAIKILSDPKGYEEMSKQCLQTIMNTFRFSSKVEEVEELLK